MSTPRGHTGGLSSRHAAETRLEGAPFKALSGLDDALAEARALDLWTPRPFTLRWIAALFLAVLAAYAYQAVIPALNADDIIQQQKASDALTMAEQGRWGYYLVYRWVFDYSPAPLFSTLIASALLVATGLLAAQVLRLRSSLAIAALVLVSSISVYYEDLFAFDSTRVPYTLANLLAVWGLLLVLDRRSLLGVALLACAPAFYPASSELAATLLLAAFVLHFLRAKPSYTLGRLIWSGVAIVVALVVYAVGTRLAYAALGLTLGDRNSISPLAIVDNLWALRDLVLRHALPILDLPNGPYLGAALTVLVTLALAAHGMWLAGHLRTRGVWRTALASLAAGVLLLTPFFLLFGNASIGFPARSLYAFSLAHAFWLAAILDWAALQEASPWRRRAGASVLVLALAIVLASAFQISKRSYESHLAYQADVLATNRIISRIETVLAENGRGLDEATPLAVIFDRPEFAGPRGRIDSARQAPWSREWIFHLVSRDLVPATPEQYRQASKAAAAHGEWPARDSVFLSTDGIVVVVVSKAPAAATQPSIQEQAR